jgi:hypothetical protein
MSFHAVSLKSHCQNRIQANGTGSATTLCNFNTPSPLLVFSMHHISLYMQRNTCSCLYTSSTYGTPHSVQLSCFIHPVPLLPVTIFRHDRHDTVNTISFKIINCSTKTDKCPGFFLRPFVTFKLLQIIHLFLTSSSMLSCNLTKTAHKNV